MKGDIAIVGMAGMFPGASSAQEYWQNIVDNKESLTNLFDTGRNLSERLREYQHKPGFPPRAGLLQDLEYFDFMFFSVSPVEAVLMSPQQRKSLEIVWQVLEDSGYNPAQLEEQDVGVFWAYHIEDYKEVLIEDGVDYDPAMNTGLNSMSLSNRISYHFNLRGPSETVNTGCSGSLVALNNAVKAIRSGQCASALVGGVNLLFSKRMFDFMYHGNMLSPDGVCRPLDELANGMVRAEGCAGVLLKPLSDAVQANDNIHAVIRGVATCHGGRSKGFTVPSEAGQVSLIKRAVKDANINPNRISYIELHGTGTPIGDPIEIKSLKLAFRELAQQQASKKGKTGAAPQRMPAVSEPHCGIGSVKSNIGHLEAASGMAGLFKVIFQLKHQQLAATLHCNEVNAYISLKKSPFYVVQENQPWQTEKSRARVAGVSSFGLGGTVAHAILQEYIPRQAEPENPTLPKAYLIPVSAETDAQLRQQLENLRAVIAQNNSDISLHSLAYTLQAGRLPMACRGVFVVSSLAEWQTCLSKVLSGDIRQNQSDKYQYACLDDADISADISADIRNAVKEPNSSSSAAANTSAKSDAPNDAKTAAKTASKNSIWQQRKTIVALAQQWLAGNHIDWQSLYPDATPRKISLTVYPFLKEKCWPEKPLQPVSPLPALVPVLVSELQNSLQNTDEHNSENKHTYRITFNGDEQYFTDHLVNGAPVLPGSAYMEIIRAAIDSTHDTPRTEAISYVMQNVCWMSAFVFSAQQPSLTVELSKKRDGDYRFQVFSESANTSQAQVHCEGVVSTRTANSSAKSSGTASDTSKPMALPDWGQNAPNSRSHEACYQVFSSIGLAYGATHRVIRGIQHDDHTLVAQLALPEGFQANTETSWFSINLLDGVFQSLIGYFWQVNATLLPFSFERLDAYAPFPSEFTAVVTNLSPNAKQGDMSKFDLALCQPNGSVFARTTGLCLRTLPVVSGNDAVQAAEIDGVEDKKSEDKNSEDKHNKAEYFSDVFACVPQWLPKPVPKPVSAVNEHTPEAGSEAGHIISFSADAAINRALQQLAQQNQHITLTTFAPPGDLTGFAPLFTQVFDCVKSSIASLSNTSAHANKSGLRIQLIYDDTPTSRLLNGLSGLAKSINKESSRVFVQTLGLHAEMATEEAAQAALNNLFPADLATRDIEVRYVAQNNAVMRQIRTFQQQDLHANLHSSLNAGSQEPGQQQCPWKNKGVYLITGGLGGLGLILARDIAANVEDPVIVLVGRSAADKVSAQLEQLQQQGLPCEYFAVDLDDADSVAQMIHSIVERHHTINGVIHSAGMVRDNYLAAKSTDEFNAVIAPKVSGVVNLDAALGDMALDFFALFSSTAGAGGNAGQSDYATGNAFMDAFAHWRNLDSSAAHVSTDRSSSALSYKRRGKTVSINWPYWRDGGMRVSEQVEQGLYRDAAMLPLETNKGIAALYGALLLAPQQWVVVQGDVARLQQIWTPELSAQSKAHSQSPSQGPSQEQSEAEPEATQNPEPASMQQANQQLEDRTIQFLAKVFTEQLKLPRNKIRPDMAMEKYGIDSVLSIKMIGQLEETFESLPKALFFEYRTIRELAQYFITQHFPKLCEVIGFTPGQETSAPAPLPNAAAVSAMPVPTQELTQEPAQKAEQIPAQINEPVKEPVQEIAIVGVAGKFPKASNMEQYWQNLSSGKDCIEQVPVSWWSQRYSDGSQELTGSNDSTASFWGGFIDDIDQFDPAFFNIAPNAAAVLSPECRLLMETTWQLLASSGFSRQWLEQHYGSSVAVYVGAMYQHYQLFNSTDNSDRVTSLSTFSAIANRISHYFGFNGPSVAIDTMCSSSFVAIKMACDSLKNGEAKLAIAGAVNLSLHPKKYFGLVAEGMLGTHQHSRSFCEGDGYIPAEGVGAVLLLPLQDAIDQRCDILGVIKSLVVNHGGGGSAYSVPVKNAQMALISETLSQSGVEPRSVSYVESAATGSALGDAIELDALTSVFKQHTHDKGFCAIGSAKSAIGHAEAASGMSQLAKVLLQLKHKKLIPILYGDNLNPNLNFASSAFYPQTELADWVRPELDLNGSMQTFPRRALITSFGAGGTNASMLLEEYQATSAPRLPKVKTGLGNEYVFPLSALSEPALITVARQLWHYLDTHPTTALGDLAYSLQSRRDGLDCRLAIVAQSVEQLKTGLAQWIKDPNLPYAKDEFVIRHQGDIYQQSEAMAFLLSGDIETIVVQRLINNRDFDKLAAYWVNGGEVDWREVQHGGARYLSNLPAYPLNKQRYWVATAGLNEESELSEEYGLNEESGRSEVHEPAQLTPEKPATSQSTSDQLTTEEPAQPLQQSQPLQDWLQQNIADELGLDSSQIMVQKPLHNLGYTSLSAINLKTKVEQHWSVVAPISVFNAFASVQSLAAKLSELLIEQEPIEQEQPEAPLLPQDKDALVPGISPDPANQLQPFPLNEIQESFLGGRNDSLDAAAVGSHIYIEMKPPTLDLERHDLERLDLARLELAWTRMIHRHAMLRANILATGRQVIQSTVTPYRIALVNPENTGDEAAQQALLSTREAMSHKVYRAGQWPMFDIRVTRLDNTDVIHFSIDELIADAFSIEILMQQWWQFYVDPALVQTELQLSFRDVVLANRDFAQSVRARTDLAYWKQKLPTMAGGPQLPFASDQQKTASDKAKIRTRKHALIAPPQWAQLSALATELHVSPTALLLHVFSELLRSWSAQRHFSVILTYFNRPDIHPQINDVVGLFISTLIFDCGEGEHSWKDALQAGAQRTQQQLFEHLDHGSVSGVRVLREGRRNRTFNDQTRFPVVFTSMLSHNDLREQGSFMQNVHYLVTQTPQVLLDCQVRTTQGALEISWDVAEAHFQDGVIERMFDHFINTLDALAAQGMAFNSKAAFANPVLENSVFENSVFEKPLLEKPASADVPVLTGEKQFRLTEPQQSYAFGKIDQSSSKSARIYTVFDADRIDIPALQQAINKLVERHAMLRAVINENGTATILDKADTFTPTVNDFRDSAEPANTLFAQVEQRMMTAATPFGCWPNFAVEVTLVSPARARLHTAFDMIICDGNSVNRFHEELFLLYRQAEAPGESKASLAPLRIDFSAYQAQLREQMPKEQATRCEQYWQHKLSNLPSAPELAIPVFSTLPGAKEGNMRRLGASVAGWQQAKQQAQAMQIDPAMLLLTAYAQVMAAFSGNQPFTITVPTFPRQPIHPDVNAMLGDFTTMCWFTFDGVTRPFSEQLAHNHNLIQQDLQHSDVSGLKVLRKLVYKQRRSDNYLFPIVFTNWVVEQQQGVPEPFEFAGTLSQTSNVHIDNINAGQGDTLHIHWDVIEGVYAMPELEQMFQCYVTTLNHLFSHVDEWQQMDLSAFVSETRAQAGISSGTSKSKSTHHTANTSSSAIDPQVLALLKKLSTGEISAQQAGKALGEIE